MKIRCLTVPRKSPDLGASNTLRTILSNGVCREGMHYYRREIQ